MAYSVILLFSFIIFFCFSEFKVESSSVKAWSFLVIVREIDTVSKSAISIKFPSQLYHNPCKNVYGRPM